jgi:hypothetical protein
MKVSRSFESQIMSVDEWGTGYNPLNGGVAADGSAPSRIGASLWHTKAPAKSNETLFGTPKSLNN